MNAGAEVVGILILQDGPETETIAGNGRVLPTTLLTIEEAGHDLESAHEETDALRTTVNERVETATRVLGLPLTAVSDLDPEVKELSQNALEHDVLHQRHVGLDQLIDLGRRHRIANRLFDLFDLFGRV